jgi:hypothetical protein
MDLFWQITITVFGAVFGAMVSFVLPIVLNNKRFKKRPKLLGSWKSAYRPDFRDSTSAITEDVEIDLRFGKLRIRNRNNPSGDAYVVHADLVQRMYLTGQWVSLKRGANAFGAIILTISPLGNLMYGYFTGLGNSGERTYCGWVLGRTQKDLTTALELLRRSTLNVATPRRKLENRDRS